MLLCFSLLLLLIPATPTISLRIFQWREPWYRVPLELAGPIQIRKDPYGSGEFGAHRSGRRRHRGLDLTAPIGTNVLAAKSGKAWIGRVRSGMGRYVEIRHLDGWATLYAHLKEIRIQDGRMIRRGEVLGTVGKTGNARRRLIQPHLHFEIWNEGGAPVNPMGVMKLEENG